MMEEKNTKLLFLIDILSIYTFFFLVFIHYNDNVIISLEANILMVLILIYWFIITIKSDLLKLSCLPKSVKIIRDSLVAYSLLSTITIATVAIFGEFRPNDKLILYPLLFSFILSTLIRLFFGILMRYFLCFGCHRKNIIIVGNGQLANHIIKMLVSTHDIRFNILGLLTDQPLEDIPEEIYLGRVTQLTEVLNAHRIDEVIIAESLCQASIIKFIIQKCEQEGIRSIIVPDFYDIIPKWTVQIGFGNLPVIAARNEPLNISRNRIIKRTFDFVVSLTGLIVLFPMFLIIAISIKLTSPGPVLFRQKRIGNNNTEFSLFKFRSMVVQSRKESDTKWTRPDDERITQLGRILRKSNLDELPQLWNVLMGDMSIVGPRPERAHFVNQFSMEIPNYRIRHLVKSGITGLAQANGWRGNTSIKKRIESDLYYIENWSLWLDLKIIFHTLFNWNAWKNAI